MSEILTLQFLSLCLQVQEGFGWTNGAILHLIWTFRAANRIEKPGEVSLNSSQQSILVYAAAGFCAFVAMITLVKGIIRRKRQHGDDTEAQENLLGSEHLEDEL